MYYVEFYLLPKTWLNFKYVTFAIYVLSEDGITRRPKHVGVVPVFELVQKVWN